MVFPFSRRKPANQASDPPNIKPAERSAIAPDEQTLAQAARTPSDQPIIDPVIRLQPLRQAVASDQASTVELLISIATPELPADQSGKPRPPLNLALVIDRSGSMRGRKLSHARKAARFLARQLTGRDRLAIVVFDDEVKVVMPSTPVSDPQPFIAAINTIHSGSSTALFDGWLAGATQVAKHLDPSALNRVLLLSDGQANAGLTDQRQIAKKVAGLTARGISTSAFGLGEGFDEDLMGAIASAGDGTLAFIESPDQLADLYASELQELASTLGRQVAISLTSSHGAAIVDVLNDLERNGNGSLQLPNLRAGQELQVGVRLQLPAWAADQNLLTVQLTWEAPGSSERKTLSQSLALPVMPATDLKDLEDDPAVAEQLALLKANRERRRAIELLDLGDIEGAQTSLFSARGLFSKLRQSALTSREMSLLDEECSELEQDRNRSRKRLSLQSLRSSLNTWDGGDESA